VNASQKISISIPSETMTLVKRRAAALKYRKLSQYFQFLVENDLETGGSHTRTETVPHPPTNPGVNQSVVAAATQIATRNALETALGTQATDASTPLPHAQAQRRPRATPNDS
jgi:hypothetical protein